MRDFLATVRSKAFKPTISIQSLRESELSGSEDNQNALEQKGLADPESGKKLGFFARPWTRRRIAIVSGLGLLVAVLVALVIALPIVLTRDHYGPNMGDTYTLYPTTHEDPSYRITENKPVFAIHNFPDPGLIQLNGTWYAFGTNPRKNNPETIHIPVATSTNFVNWTLHEGYDAMPTIGNWERTINHWAPDVIQRNDGKFVLYYAGETKDFNRHHCIGAAVSAGKDPLGPYIPLNESIACPHKYGGAIDPSPFRDADGKLYIVYKGDGNSVGHGGYCGNSRKPLVSVPLILQEMENDGVTPVGDPEIILDINDTDGPLIEAPNIVRSSDGFYYLFFSSHCFTSLGYNVKYAHAASVKGPYIRVARPLLQTHDFGLLAPGGATISQDGSKIVFHANCDGWRCMYAGGIDIRSNNHTVVLTALNLEVSGSNSTNSTTSSS
ncbi:Glycoside hydrolase family 43 [Penicillium macrosclerotiorum]|uniref:Glycoside hydrolase family 43 n=1 Tax=Penicillium macrosclerotiorum TaxID=303699 RepID=UPI002548BD0D|nr:Glycoside hydrolase family 43 [Penicillium macrosclerotiorum]KAJ5689489.1 Glycoside hydrolase family 43 [Penicillium macrosclerotiorum]